LAKITDDGFDLNEFYILQVKFEGGLIIFNIKEEKNTKSPKEILRIFDPEYVLGKTGIYANGISDVYIDSFNLTHLECIGNEKITEKYHGPSCSRYKENYLGYF